MEKAKLYVVATPIGNLDDITLRAIKTLKSVDVIACEDTRNTGMLLSKLEISNSLFSYHEHNKEEASNKIIELLKNGKDVALVSDAGTPCISDPGYLVVKKVREEGFDVVPIPGASAFTSVLSVSGFATDSFIFQGFLASGNESKRKRRLKELLSLNFTVIIYEAPHRILKLLSEIENINNEAQVLVGRELTKKFEEIKTGDPKELIKYFEEKKPKGEFVVIVNKYEKNIFLNENEIKEQFFEMKINGIEEMEAIKTIAKKIGKSKSEIYGIVKKKHPDQS